MPLSVFPKFNTIILTRHGPIYLKKKEENTTTTFDGHFCIILFSRNSWLLKRISVSSCDLLRTNLLSEWKSNKNQVSSMDSNRGCVDVVQGLHHITAHRSRGIISSPECRSGSS